MELPNLGKHCSVRSCSRLDFLPFTCDRCDRTFCEDHRKYTDHSCDLHEKVAPQCPLCNQILPFILNQDINLAMDRHINAGCPQVQKQVTKKFVCTFANCDKKELQRITCQYCNKDFCLDHKHPSIHTCPKYNQAPKPNDNSAAQESFWDAVSKRISETMKSFAASDNPKARQLALNNMRAKAIIDRALVTTLTSKGPQSVPAERRVYLEVIYPMDSKVEPKLFFFDNNLRFGVVLDQIAEAGKIKNENNVGGAKVPHQT